MTCKTEETEEYLHIALWYVQVKTTEAVVCLYYQVTRHISSDLAWCPA